MKSLALFLYFLLLATSADAASLSSGAYGFGATSGTGSTDVIVSGLTTTPPGVVTFSIWFNLNANTSLQRLIFQTGCTSRCVAIDLGSTSTIVYQQAWSTSGSGIATWSVALPSLNAWHNLVVTYDNSSTFNNPIMYMDGVSQTVTIVQPPSGVPMTGTANYDIGSQGAGSNTMNGMLAEFAMWNGTILTQADVTALAQGVSPLAIGPTPPTYYAPLFGTGVEGDWGTGHTGAITVTGAKGQLGPPIMGFPLLSEEP